MSTGSHDECNGDAHEYHDHDNGSCRHGISLYNSVVESLEELEFNRGLGRACMLGDFDRAAALLAKGLNPNAYDSSGYVPLHYAARNGHARLCSLLIQNGARVNKKTRSGQATSLHRAAYAGHENIVEILLSSGADPCIQDADGCTALHKAVWQGHHGIATLLINVNKNVSNIRDNKGRLAEENLNALFS